MSNKIKNYASHDHQSKGQEMLSRPNAEQGACKMHEQTQRLAAKKIARRARKQSQLQRSTSQHGDQKLLALRVLRKVSNHYPASDW
jgi:hypothetical protein